MILHLNHHPTLTIDRDKVKIELDTCALNNKIPNLEISITILVNETYKSTIRIQLSTNSC